MPQPADIVVVNGKLFGTPYDREQLGAVAVNHGNISFIGCSGDVVDFIGNSTQLIDARGNSVLPGFIDSHVHFSSGGFGLSGIQLGKVLTPGNFIKTVAEYTRQLPRGEWVTGGRWNHELWHGSSLPSKEWIDQTTPHNPVLLSRYDGHMCIANSFALKLAGITRETAAPPGGMIERDSTGEPTGILKDEAISIVQKIMPVPSEEQLTRAIKAALYEASRFGITGIHDNAGMPEINVYRKLHEQGELTCRVYGMVPLGGWKSAIEAAAGNERDQWIRVKAVKGFADGSLGSSTALFFEPYADNPHNYGLPSRQIAEGKMLGTVSEADKAGVQICIHAIGDKANSIILDMYEDVVRANGGAPEKRRFRIEHAQHLRKDDIKRFSSLGVVASVQPYHLFEDGSWAEKRIGKERCKTTYAFNQLISQHVTLAFGSDWPVVPINPLSAIHSAITRQTSDGKNPNGWIPEEKISLDEAISAYTSGSAFAEFAENEKGSLRVGKLADIVVLDTDLSRGTHEINSANVSHTIVGGKLVYQNNQ